MRDVEKKLIPLRDQPSNQSHGLRKNKRALALELGGPTWERKKQENRDRVVHERKTNSWGRKA